MKPERQEKKGDDSCLSLSQHGLHVKNNYYRQDKSLSETSLCRVSSVTFDALFVLLFEAGNIVVSEQNSAGNQVKRDVTGRDNVL